MAVTNHQAELSGPTIIFDQVSLTFAATAILHNISLTIQAGSIHAIIGPNGGGKSSLVKTLLGQMPHQGEVSIKWPSKAHTIGYVPQFLEFDHGLPLTVDDFLAAMTQRKPAFWGFAKSHQAQINQALALVGMTAKRQRKMGALSGGERQRILLAQSLIPFPQLLILDEPMSAIDESGVQIFDDILQQSRDKGVTVLWIEHDLQSVKQKADRVTAIQQEIILDGLPKAELTSENILRMYSKHPQLMGD